MMMKAESGGFWRVESMPYLTDRALGSLRTPREGLPACRSHAERTQVASQRGNTLRGNRATERGAEPKTATWTEKREVSVWAQIPPPKTWQYVANPPPKTFTQPGGCRMIPKNCLIFPTTH